MKRKSVEKIIVVFLILAYLYQLRIGIGTILFVASTGNFFYTLYANLSVVVLPFLIFCVPSLSIIYTLLRQRNIGYLLNLVDAIIWLGFFICYALFFSKGLTNIFYDAVLTLQIILSFIGLRINKRSSFRSR